MAELFWDPKGATVTIDGNAAGKAVGATLAITRKASRDIEFNATTCMEEQGTARIYGVSGVLTLELQSGADLQNMAYATCGTLDTATIDIGEETDIEHAISIVATNSASCSDVYTYTFPRCEVADDQEHIFAVPSDTDAATNLTLSFNVLLAAGATSLGTMVKT